MFWYSQFDVVLGIKLLAAELPSHIMLIFLLIRLATVLMCCIKLMVEHKVQGSEKKLPTDSTGL